MYNFGQMSLNGDDVMNYDDDDDNRHRAVRTSLFFMWVLYWVPYCSGYCSLQCGKWQDGKRQDEVLFCRMSNVKCKLEKGDFLYINQREFRIPNSQPNRTLTLIDPGCRGKLLWQMTRKRFFFIILDTLGS